MFIKMKYYNINIYFYLKATGVIKEHGIDDIDGQLENKRIRLISFKYTINVITKTKVFNYYYTNIICFIFRIQFIMMKFWKYLTL